MTAVQNTFEARVEKALRDAAYKVTSHKNRPGFGPTDPAKLSRINAADIAGLNEFAAALLPIFADVDAEFAQMRHEIAELKRSSAPNSPRINPRRY